uniref:Uncharacterized protein n=1 Tax=Callorhinchus milii TaxID=7868 RepID=A0A4W3JUV7_CALMI
FPRSHCFQLSLSRSLSLSLSLSLFVTLSLALCHPLSLCHPLCHFLCVTHSLSLSLCRAFKINELKTEVTNRLAMLEKRVELEALKVVEIEKCRSDIKKLRDEMTLRNSRSTSLSSLRTIALCMCVS